MSKKTKQEKICITCGKEITSRYRALFKWNPDELSSNKMTIQPEEIEKLIAGYVCDPCYEREMES